MYGLCRMVPVVVCAVAVVAVCSYQALVSGCLPFESDGVVSS